jgi:molybdopterin-containing oxidoreductase family iron-sulfur binding subunit
MRIEERDLGKLSRRGFLRLAAGGGGTVLAAGWGEKVTDRLIPYVVPPEHIRPGVWNYFATTCRECPAGCGMHVWHRDGRVTKVEGNPEHPINRGGLCARGQSAVQGLYDPDRLRRPLYRAPGAEAKPVAWAAAIERIGKQLAEAKGKVVVLSDLQAGAMAGVFSAFAAAFGATAPLAYEALNYEAVLDAHEAAFGLRIIPDYRIEASTLLISFGADFLETWISPVAYAQRFSLMRTLRDGRMGRFIYVGPRLSMTAANADEFIRVPPGAEAAVAAAMLGVMVERGWVSGEAARLKAPAARLAEVCGKPAGVAPERIEALAREFAEAKGSLALAGPAADSGPAGRAAALAAAMLNYAAGRIGRTVDFARPHALGATARHAQVEKAIAGLTPDDVLIIHNANPVYAMPRAVGMLRRAGTVVYLGTMQDETAALAGYVLPVDSPLESWGDYEPAAGLHSLMQPTMSRLFDTRAAGDVLLDLARAAGKRLTRPNSDKPPGDFLAWLRQRWAELAARIAPAQPFEGFWQAALLAGGVWEEPKPVSVQLKAEAAAMNLPAPPAEHRLSQDAANLWPWPHVFLFDGRGANRGWLQEAPDPTTHIVWGSWVDVHPVQAKALGLADGDVVEIAAAGAGKVEAPVRVTLDVCEGTVAIPFGQGHTALGRNAAGRGANAFALLGGEVAAGTTFGRVTIRKTGRREEITRASSGEQGQHGRKIVRWTTPAEMQKPQPGSPEHFVLPLPEGYTIDKDLYPPRAYPDHRWAMVVDLARCTGCGACAVACYAENNVAVVGPEHTRRGRHMAWLQVVPYRDPADARRMGFLPLMCQHCDAAPCEPVCPVYAAVHSDEGLNSQVYNRCIGTRYCMNNCPYKVRRFNWINVDWQKPLALQLNPEVTVRSRGVMEKCTFCIQRIRQAEHRAKREGRKVRDGEVQPACAQTCPARAITFGDLMDAGAEVTRLTRADPRRYHVLGELNTKPGVAYLKRIKADVINNV